MKMCQLWPILDLATQSNSWQWFLKYILVAEKWMFQLGKKREWWSCWSNYHQKQHFPVTPTNIRITEIPPLSRASDNGNRLCVRLLLFDKMYHFMKSACIYGMILTMELCSPLFPRFIGQKWKRRCANLWLFHIQPSATPPASGFRN